MLSIAYPGAMKYYYKTIREMPAGWGFADVIFIPKKASASLRRLPWVLLSDYHEFRLGITT